MMKNPIYLIEAIYILERLDDLGNKKHPIIISELICPKSDLWSSIRFLKTDVDHEDWQTGKFDGVVFACYTIALEYIDDPDGPYEYYIFNKDIERIMNIQDPRPFREEGYKD
jgi:hypothetical protein